MKLSVQPLTKPAFAPYGDVISTDENDHFLINNGSTERYHDLAKVDLLEGGRALINIFRATPLSYPLNIRMVERHPLGSQAFIPLNGRPYLVLVAPAGETVAPSDLRVFLARGDQGVNYHAGTWHHPVLALGAVSDFLVVDRGGDGDNCEELFFAEPEIWLDVPEGP
ncbi:ureidoglycolate lyase [Sneathiella chinensis]|uniref:Ureidoglycolate lyase n=1 Tax=Sneathiella chinensis TaxID=349750 RepID=A0ABQ5U206_9PROT|nr:ureidoglycolate lyase [Sneathiella chinensis]GLQ06157.1 ureidoglycolate lyase [Sneathiella chinensis]